MIERERGTARSREVEHEEESRKGETEVEHETVMPILRDSRRGFEVRRRRVQLFVFWACYGRVIGCSRSCTVVGLLERGSGTSGVRRGRRAAPCRRAPCVSSCYSFVF